MFAIYKKLGIKSYAEYLASDHWQEVRNEAWHRLDRKCSICNDTKDLLLHHRTYETLGAEKVGKDVCFLCPLCHEYVHFYDDGSKVILDFDHLWKREEDLRRARGNFFYRMYTAPLGDVINRLAYSIAR